MHEAGEEDDGKGRAIVLEEDADWVTEQGAVAELAASVRDHEDQQGHHDGEVEGRLVAEALEHLDTLL